MRILSLDPGSRFTGFALMENGKVLTSGVWVLDKEEDLPKRIKLLVSELKTILKLYSPTTVVLESLIFVKNPSSLMKLAQIRGAMLAAITEIEIEIFEYSPNFIKQIVTGHGHADKEAVQKWITLQTGVQVFKTDDESDAIAIALCHWLSSKNKVQMDNLKSKSKNKSLKKSLAHAVRKELV